MAGLDDQRLLEELRRTRLVGADEEARMAEDVRLRVEYVLACLAEASLIGDDGIEAPLLLVVGGQDSSWSAVPRTGASIGSGADCDVRIRAPGVSRRHCHLSAGEHGMEIVDLDSRNGTFVNGQRRERTGLRDWDVVGIGKAVLVFFAQRPPQDAFREEQTGGQS